MNKCVITVPASSANVGPGFDSVGIAVSKYLTLTVEEADHWEFEHHSVHLPPVSDPHEHLIYQSALKTAEAYHASLPACKVIVESDIPLARGLGSSASAIVSGIELANQLCCLSLSEQEKLAIATEIEGHPDNVAAALLGGFVITSQLANGEIEWFRKIDQQVEFVVSIPEFELKTDDARQVLPEQFTRNEAAAASSIANIVFVALLSGDYEQAGKLMEQDLFHEPYRAGLIPNYEKIRFEAKSTGAYGTVISGAGPTTISLVGKGNGEKVALHLKSKFPDYTVDCLKMTAVGVQVHPVLSSTT
ncbi:homoserine kinase [Lederbergia galactosidilytica]|uniref:Homoserine kinase n=1 Tax=Lederbergia galactosidilytica TaxID=217031 RepID=A0A177ZRI2_9BACI|nr:homoserine kinase [Lederbergia galactosidilytica]KRG12974.1 serine kinase [Virgibacillus soli]MBP1916188.1 homoserine kinase [Lederbergia galactosidilytica]OAK70203.1 serine kinase [Lederbergia galactosidilytica]